MRVVIDKLESAAVHALYIKAPLGTCEVLQRILDDISRNTQPVAARECRCSVQDIVFSRDSKLDLAEVLAVIVHMERRHAISKRYI